MYFKKMLGEKCYLSPIDVNDAEKYTAWLNDLEIVNNLSLSTVNIEILSEKEILSKLAREHNYAIVDVKTNELIGNIGLINMDNLQRTTEIGLFIGDKKFWNKGYGTEALKLLIDFSYKFLNLNNIMLRVYEFNVRGIKCYEKVGFKKVGVIRQGLWRDRQPYNVVLMDLLPEDFYSKK